MRFQCRDLLEARNNYSLFSDDNLAGYYWWCEDFPYLRLQSGIDKRVTDAVNKTKCEKKSAAKERLADKNRNPIDEDDWLIIAAKVEPIQRELNE